MTEKFIATIFSPSRNDPKFEKIAQKVMSFLVSSGLVSGIISGGYDIGVMGAIQEYFDEEKSAKADERISNQKLVVSDLGEELIKSNGRIISFDTITHRYPELINNGDCYIAFGFSTGVATELQLTLENQLTNLLLPKDKQKAIKPIILINPNLQILDLLTLLQSINSAFKKDNLNPYLDHIYVISSKKTRAN